MKKKACAHSVVLLFLSLSVIRITYANKTNSAENHQIITDPRVELISIV